jgi:hypothetical protein
LRQVAAADREGQLATWTAISKLAHPHLIRLLDSGRCEIAGVPLLYVAMERADGDLAEVLPERPLTAVEAREMLESAIDALAYLHEKGFAHGAVKPSNIMAVGEQIKLSSDSVTRDGEIAGDVWSLGATLVEALTQRPPDLTAEVSIPEPFASIARHCLAPDPRARWTVSQIASRLHGLEIATPAAPAPQPPRDKPRSRTPLYWIGGGAVAAIAIALMLGHQPRPSTAEPEHPAAAATPVPQPPPVAVAPDPQPPAVVTAPVAAPPPAGRAVNKSDAWYVVVATYAQQPDAEKRARAMTREWPDFKVEVYAPPLENKKPYYLVVVGANLSEQAATELRDRARSAGLAHDAYSTKFTR